MTASAQALRQLHATEEIKPTGARADDRLTPSSLERVASSIHGTEKAFRGMGYTERRGREAARTKRK